VKGKRWWRCGRNSASDALARENWKKAPVKPEQKWFKTAGNLAPGKISNWHKQRRQRACGTSKDQKVTLKAKTVMKQTATGGLMQRKG